MEQAELAEITRAIKESMTETAGQFRAAAAANNANLYKILKDVYGGIRAQRDDLAELANSTEETFYETREVANKIDFLSSIFKDATALLTSISGEMKTVGDELSILNNSTENLNKNMVQGPNSLLGGILEGLKDLGGIVNSAIAGIAVGTGASYLMNRGSESQGGASTTPMSVSGNAGEAMSFFQSKGWTKEQSAGIVGNLQVESGNFSPDVLSGKRKGDGGIAVGVAQWHPDRQRKFQEVMHKPLIGSSFQDQLEFVNWELNNSHANAGRMLRGAKDAASAAEIVDAKYEISSGAHRAKRMANAENLMKSQEGATPQASTPNTAMPTSPAMDINNLSGQGKGPISGPAMNTEKASVGTPMPSNDIVSLGKYLQSQGIRVSEHPAFGGVNPGSHHPNSAHNDGLAIDINAPGNVIEANDPVWGQKFDELAKQIQAAGYTVLWRAKDHYNHIHAQLGGKGIKGGQSVIGGQTTPSATPTPTTPSAAASAMTPGTVVTPSSPTMPSATTPSQVEQTAPAATPVERSPMVPGVSAAISPMQMMGMMGGMGMGGGLIGMMPMLLSALGNIGGNIPNMGAPVSDPIAELLDNISGSLSGKTINETSISREVQQEMALSSVNDQTQQTFNPDKASYTNNRMAFDQPGYNYNMPGDVGWPDWASMLGGNHWPEMSKFKRNLWEK